MQVADTKPGFYYVTVRRDGGAYRRLLGPYENDHATALDSIPEARLRANEVDPRAPWYSYGTARTEQDMGPGLFNDTTGENQ